MLHLFNICLFVSHSVLVDHDKQLTVPRNTTATDLKRMTPLCL